MRDAGLPRWIEAPLALGGLLASAWVLVAAAVAIRLNSPGPVLFRQTRVGLGGRTFTLLKLRTMTHRVGGPAVTSGGDARITAVGKVLRRTKIDELPQLWNVVRGELSFVGPRPEVPTYVDQDDPDWQAALSVRPGLTSEVTLRLRDEEDLLRRLAERTGEDAETVYRHRLLPWKVRAEADAARRRGALGDLACLLRTVGALFGGPRPATPDLDELTAPSA